MGWALVFCRLIFAASEYASLHWPTKKLAALAALLVGGGYMVLTGMHVPIVRSFAMACLYTAALLAGRQAISLRGLALAAVVLMLLVPQEVPGVSFQMSFSAVLALISGYETSAPALHKMSGRLMASAVRTALGRTGTDQRAGRHRLRALRSLSLRSNPGLFHHCQHGRGTAGRTLGHAGRPDRPLAAAVRSRLAGIRPDGLGSGGHPYVARTTASWPAATFDVPHMPLWGLTVTALGVAWLGLWRTRVRLAGVPVLVVALLSPWLIRPADVLVSADARLIGVRVHDAVYLQSVAGASKFTRDAWLQYWAPARCFQFPKEPNAWMVRLPARPRNACSGPNRRRGRDAGARCFAS